MLLENKDITYLDIKKYWFTLFHELDSMDELDSILENVSNIDPKKIESFITNYSEINEIDIDKLLEKDRFSILEEISSDIKDQVPFFNLFTPIINYFIGDFCDKIKPLKIIESTRDFLKVFIKNQCQTLIELAQRTLVLEVNIARMNGSLKGNSPEDRFNYYTNVLLKDKSYLKQFYKEYFHLYTLMTQRCQWSFQFMLEVLSLTQQHIWEIKKDILCSWEDVKIESISSSLGDSHNKGKTVSLINLTNGKKIVFKPRSLELEVGFNKFISYINQKETGKETDLYEIKVVSGDDYGFSEYIEYNECSSEEEIKQFYYRTGKLLAALFVLNAKDIHHENIIAMGCHPVVVDLEALFHSSVSLIDQMYFCSSEIAQEIIDSSVYSIGFLPQKISNPYEETPSGYVDVSAFGGEENQVAPFTAFKVVGGNTDEIRIEKVEGFIESQNNNPKVNGEIRKSEDYIYEIKKGFSDVYDLMYSNRKEAEGLVQSIFEGMKNRFILRPTYIYGQLMRTSYHPDFMRDKLHRFILLHRLGVNVEDKFNKIVSSEIHDILQGDVPYFYAYVDSNEIRNSTGSKIGIELDKSPLEKVVAKIANLNSEDKKRQLHFIDMSFLAKTTNSQKDETATVFSDNCSKNTIDKDEIMKLALQIGDYVIEKSILGYSEKGIDRTWISTILIGRDECTWSLSPVGNNLYDGNAGIALFLGYLGKLTGRQYFINAASEALEGVIKTVELLDSKYPFLIGPYNGITGYFYALSKLYKISGNQRFLKIIKDNISLLYNLIPKDKNIDVIGGAAGAIGALLSIYHDIEDDSELRETLLDLCLENFKHIKVSALEFFNDSYAWGSGGVYLPSTGFAHGNAGIAAYLSKLYSITKNDEILDVIKKALNYERHLYIETKKNWQSSHTKERFSLAWCHGAPGILLSRLMLKDSGYNDEYIDNEINAALETTIKQGFGNNPCYCHGDVGNLSILEYAAEVLQDEELKNRCNNTFNDIFDNLIKDRWNKGVYSGTESMGLMIGLSCFGYGLLKKYDYAAVSPILWLE